MKKVDFQSVVYQEGKYFVAQCLNVDVSSFGSTQKEALSNLQEALELYLEDSNSTSTPVSHPTLHTLRLQDA